MGDAAFWACAIAHAAAMVIANAHITALHEKLTCSSAREAVSEAAGVARPPASSLHQTPAVPRVPGPEKRTAGPSGNAHPVWRGRSESPHENSEPLLRNRS